MIDRECALEQALVMAAIPLEVLHGDNTMGATWMHPDLRQAVADALQRIRELVVLRP